MRVSPPLPSRVFSFKPPITLEVITKFCDLSPILPLTNLVFSWLLPHSSRDPGSNLISGATCGKFARSLCNRTVFFNNAGWWFNLIIAPSVDKWLNLGGVAGNEGRMKWDECWISVNEWLTVCTDWVSWRKSQTFGGNSFNWSRYPLHLNHISLKPLCSKVINTNPFRSPGNYNSPTPLWASCAPSQVPLHPFL